MTQRFETTYKIAKGTNLGDPKTWNVRFADIDLRLNAAENQYAKFDAAADTIIALGITRINTTFQPLLNSLTATVNQLSATVVQLQTDIVEQGDTVSGQLATILADAQAALAGIVGLGDLSDGAF